MDGVFFDIQATNLLDREYRQYPGLPIIEEESYLKQRLIFNINITKVFKKGIQFECLFL